jgi:peroxiredoxin Q/BCP
VKRFKPGATAPDFTLPNDAGIATSLRSHRGRTTVLYFIPKAGSPGCSEQACALMAVAKKHRLAVVGVAPDSQKKLANFRKRFGLPFTLLSDANQAVAKRYGVWVEKQMYGHTFMGMERVTLILDADGRILHTIAGVTPKMQPAEVAKFLDAP